LADIAAPKPAMRTVIVATDRRAIWGFAKLFAPALGIARGGKLAFVVKLAGFASHGPRRLPAAGVAAHYRALKAAPAAQSTTGK